VTFGASRKRARCEGGGGAQRVLGGAALQHSLLRGSRSEANCCPNSETSHQSQQQPAVVASHARNRVSRSRNWGSADLLTEIHRIDY
jgi:hypothetical protein